MGIISLLTDFGLKDPYVGIMKGVMLGINPQARLVDITHEVQSQDVSEAAFLLPEYYRFFPPRTVHLCVVDPTVGSERRALVVLKDEHLFVGPDNGLFSFVFDGATVHELSNRAYALDTISGTFHGRDVFAPAAAYLSLGLEPGLVGPLAYDFARLPALNPSIVADKLVGEIVRFDRFGNAVSNIRSTSLADHVQNSPFRIELGALRFDRVSRSYWEQTLSCLVGSSGYLEFALFRGSLRDDRGIQKGDRVTIVRLADRHR